MIRIFGLDLTERVAVLTKTLGPLRTSVRSSATSHLLDYVSWAHYLGLEVIILANRNSKQCMQNKCRRTLFSEDERLRCGMHHTDNLIVNNGGELWRS